MRVAPRAFRYLVALNVVLWPMLFSQMYVVIVCGAGALWLAARLAFYPWFRARRLEREAAARYWDPNRFH